MTSRPMHAHKKNLEQIGRERVSGPWLITPYWDLVSERKFLFFKLKSKACSMLHPSVPAFRVETATALSPSTCPQVMSLSKENDCIEFFTPFCNWMDTSKLDDGCIIDLVQILIRTIARFEKYRFTAFGLARSAIAKTEKGKTALLPIAYILPFELSEAGPNEIAGHEGEKNSEPAYGECHLLDGWGNQSAHLSQLKNIMEELAARSTRKPSARSGRRREDGCEKPGRSFSYRLLEASRRITSGKISSLDELHWALFDQPLERGLRPFRPGRADQDFSRKINEKVDSITRLASSGGVIVLKGEPFSGKSAILGKIAERLRKSRPGNTSILDEWDLFSSNRRKANQAGSNGREVILLIDDMEEKAFAYSKLAMDLLREDELPFKALIMTMDPKHAPDEAKCLLKEMKSRLGGKYTELSITDPPPENCESTSEGAAATGVSRQRDGSELLRSSVKAILHRLLPDGPSARDPSPASTMKGILSNLGEEERQLLEFLSVARLTVPLDFISPISPHPNPGLSKSIHRLASLYLVDAVYRLAPQSNSISIFLRVKNASLRRLVYAGIPEARRKNLHRTIALLGKEHRSFPAFHLLYHLLKGEERLLAAKHCVSYLKSKSNNNRQPFFIDLCRKLVRKSLHEVLALPDQIYMLREIGNEYLKNGKVGEAEKLLLLARDVIAKTDIDERRKNASLMSATCRLLSDIWELRGAFKKSLDLLNRTREELQSALSIPDQAQLFNDIGWLQYRLGDYESSMKSCKLSLNSLNANQHPLIVAQALNIMGVVHFNTSRYDEAISYYEQSAFLRERAKDENALSASYNNLGLVYQTKGEYERALEYYNESLEIKKRQRNRPGTAAGYLNLALLHLEMHNFRAAEEKCKESLAISRELGNAQLTAENYSTLGDIAFTKGQIDEAEKYYSKSLRISRRLETINGEMGALRRLSTLHLTQKRYKQAREHVEKASKLALLIGSKFESAEIDLILGDLERAQKKHMEAIRFYEKAASAFTTLSRYRSAATTLSKIGLVHGVSGNTFEAKQYMDRALDLVRSDIGHELPEELASLQRLLGKQPLRSSFPGKESQKLLISFYELSSLTECAFDRSEFFKKIMDILQQIVDPDNCFLALRVSDNRFTLIDSKGDQSPRVEEGLSSLFSRTLLLGCLLDDRSPDLSDICSTIAVPKGCGFVCIPLKAMGEDLGCLLFYLHEEKLPLSKENVNFFTSLGRQIAGNLKLMLHLEEHAHKEEKLEKEFESLKAQVEDRYRFENLIGKSEAMKKIFRTLTKIKDMDTGILIIGESGTGKTELARAIHYNSPRRNKAFQEIHCAQIPYNLIESELFGHERGAFTGAVQRKLGLCEIADGGTVFLDDVNVIPMEIQTKLLHFLESKSFIRLGGTKKITSNVRIIAASNENLEKLCEENKFRKDLYYRLNVLLIEIPPLRERKEDTLAIALSFLKRRCSEKGIPLKTLAPETVKLFQKAPWRGNVRELQNVLERVVLLSDDNVIYPASLPEDFLKELAGGSARGKRDLEALVQEIVELGCYSEANPLMPQLEALLARKMVDHTDGKSRAAAFLGVTKPTLYSRLKNYEKHE